METQTQPKVCYHCEAPIGEGEAHLVIAGPNGTKQFVHTACFTETTFDPDRFRVEAPESDG